MLDDYTSHYSVEKHTRERRENTDYDGNVEGFLLNKNGNFKGQWSRAQILGKEGFYHRFLGQRSNLIKGLQKQD